MAWEIKKVTLKVIDNNKTVDKLFFFGCPGTVQKVVFVMAVPVMEFQNWGCRRLNVNSNEIQYPSKWNNGKVMEVLTFRIWFLKEMSLQMFLDFLSPNLKLYHHSVSNPFRQSAVSTVHRANLEECSSISIQFILFS